MEDCINFNHISSLNNSCKTLVDMDNISSSVMKQLLLKLHGTKSIDVVLLQKLKIRTKSNYDYEYDYTTSVFILKQYLNLK